jgi:hypothetical protein
MGKIKCVKCGQIFEIPKGSCPICFSDVLGDIVDITDADKRFGELTDFINELCAYDYERGEHNAKCENQLTEDGIIDGFDFEEVEKLDTPKTDCTGICGFCEIKDTCDNPKRLKQTEKKEVED